MAGTVVRDWVAELSFCQQVVLFSASRGCDTAPKDHTSKPLVASLRYAIFHSAFENFTIPSPGNTRFMEPIPPEKIPRTDEMPVHWVGHMMHACEILGYKHPDLEQREIWHGLYLQFCHSLHVNPESEDALDERLRGELG